MIIKCSVSSKELIIPPEHVERFCNTLQEAIELIFNRGNINKAFHVYPYTINTHLGNFISIQGEVFDPYKNRASIRYTELDYYYMECLKHTIKPPE